MIIKKLVLQNFQSYAEKTVFPFSRFGTGVFFLTGTNQDEKVAMGSNGAGKSTIWDGVCWVLFGETLNKQKATDIRNWHNSSGAVTGKLFVDIRGVACIIKRTWSPNSLEIVEAGVKRTLEQADLNELLNMSHNTFKTSVVIGQEAAQFFDYTPTAKLDLFTQVLNLNRWIDYSKQAKAEADEIRATIEDSQQDVSQFKGHISALVLDKRREKAARTTWEKERTSRIASSESRVAANQKQLVVLVNTCKQLKNKIATIDEKISTKESSIRKRSDRLEGLESSLQESQLAIADTRATISANEKSMQSYLSRIADGKCSSCGQSVGSKHLDAITAPLKNNIEEAKTVLVELQEGIDDVNARISSIEKKLNPVHEAIKVLHARRRKVDGEWQTTTSQKSLKQRDVEEAERGVASVKQETNPHIANVSRILKELKQQKTGRDTVLAFIGEQEVTLSHASYWVQGFKQIRLHIIDQCLLALEVEINNVLSQFGMSGWKVTLDVEKENKTGGVTKGFQIFIESPTSPKRVPWASWSGGQKQRLRIAGTTALINLINATNGNECNIEVWDEPTNYLSVQGVDNMVSILDSRARSLNKQVWLVDHRSLDYGTFNGIWEVEYKDGKSSLAQIVEMVDE